VKKLAYIFLLLLTIPAKNFGQDVVELQKEAERLEVTNEEEAFKRYQEILNLQPLNVNALCKCSELCSTIGHRQASKTAQITYFKAGRHFAQTALRIEPTSSEANFAMCLAMGRIALISSGKEKIEAVSDIKRYAEISIKYDPTNFKPYHALGKWHYEVSDLSGLERTAAKLLYGGLPPATLKESIYYYDKSRILNPEFTLNYLELARCYHRNNQNPKAIEMLDKLMAMPVKTQDDTRVREEGKKLLKQFGS
jgi:tetratricopeptide (TPR) repeat protein